MEANLLLGRILGLLCGLSLIVIDASGQVSGTIEVSFNKSVQIILPKSTSEIILDDDFGSVQDVSAIVTPDRKKMKLKANVYHFEETNVLIETTYGHYNFVLVYNENPLTMLYNIEDYDPIIAKEINEPLEQANQISGDNDILKEEVGGKSVVVNNEVNMDLICNEVLKLPRKIHNIGEIDKKAVIYMENIVVYKEKLYFLISIENYSNITLDIDFYRVYLNDKQTFLKKTSSAPKDLPWEFIKNDELDKIEKDQKQSYVFVYKKFTIDNDKKMHFEFWEKGGERNLSLEITSRDIINVRELEF